jgi:hypothetical protein
MERGVRLALAFLTVAKEHGVNLSVEIGVCKELNQLKGVKKNIAR